MARVSLFYTVAGARFCCGFAFAPIPRSRVVALRRTWGEACLKPASRAAATTANSAWRKESAVHSVVVAPEGVEQSRSHQHEQHERHQLQPGEAAGDQDNNRRRSDSDAARAAAAARKEHLEKSRVIRPDSKRILRIPEEEWPR